MRGIQEQLVPRGSLSFPPTRPRRPTKRSSRTAAPIILSPHSAALDPYAPSSPKKQTFLPLSHGRGFPPVRPAAGHAEPAGGRDIPAVGGRDLIMRPAGICASRSRPAPSAFRKTWWRPMPWSWPCRYRRNQARGEKAERKGFCCPPIPSISLSWNSRPGAAKPFACTISSTRDSTRTSCERDPPGIDLGGFPRPGEDEPARMPSSSALR